VSAARGVVDGDGAGGAGVVEKKGLVGGGAAGVVAHLHKGLSDGGEEVDVLPEEAVQAEDRGEEEVEEEGRDSCGDGEVEGVAGWLSAAEGEGDDVPDENESGEGGRKD